MLSYSEAEKIVSKYGSPLIIYDQEEIGCRFNLLKKSFPYKHFEILYCLKANSNLSIAKIYKKLGARIDACSPGDVYIAKKAGFSANQIFVTGPSWSNDDLDYFLKEKISLDLDSISHIRRYGKINPGAEIGLRVNLGFGQGFHEHTMAGGKSSKLGITVDDLDRAILIANKHKLKIVRLHYHLFSGEFSVVPFIKAFKLCLNLLSRFPDVNSLNIGGGIGVPFHRSEKDFDIKNFGKKLVDLVEKYNFQNHKKLKIMIEPGEFLISPCGVAVGKINTLKNNSGTKFVGTDLNSNFIVGYYFYKTNYPIVTQKGQKEKVTLAGNLCQAGDLIAKDRYLSGIKEGNLILVKNVGAYAQVRAGRFNSRLKPTEILKIKNNQYKIIYKDSLQNLVEGMC